MSRYLLLTVLFAALCGACTTPGAPRVTAAALDAQVKGVLGPDFHGVVLVRDGASGNTLVRAYGMARFAPDVTAGPDTRYQIGSISKWITSVAVLRLVDQGKLGLDVPVGRYLPELPAASGNGVTLRHLLTNTSGIPNGVMQEAKKNPAIADLALSHSEAVVRFGSGALAFAPGSTWDYSPTNWTVVAAIVERVTGITYAQAVEQLVLTPAAARSSAVPLIPIQHLPGVALAYRNKLPRELATSPHVTFVAASGTLYSTAEDLDRLARAVYETALLSAAARAELSRIVVPAQNYALGGRVKTMKLGGSARTVAWETGASGGAKSLLAYVPGEHKTVVILNNTDLPQADLGRAGEALMHWLYAPAQAAR